MNRTRVALSSGATVVLDRCGSCQGIWFDSGEWNALASAHLLDHLTEFWTAEWRSRQRRELEHAHYEARLRSEFGSDLYDRLVALAHELRGHSRRSEALALIQEESRRA